jgi:hypothetical protein
MNAQSNQRDLEREVRDLDRQESKTTSEKARAKIAGKMDDPAVKVLAKQLVQIRQQRLNYKAPHLAYGMHATVTASQMYMQAIDPVTESMQAVNKHMDIKKMTKPWWISNAKTKAAVKEEMMDDMLTDAFDNDDLRKKRIKLRRRSHGTGCGNGRIKWWDWRHRAASVEEIDGRRARSTERCPARFERAIGCLVVFTMLLACSEPIYKQSDTRRSSTTHACLELLVYTCATRIREQ